MKEDEIDGFISEVAYNFDYELTDEERQKIREEIKKKVILEIQWLLRVKVSQKMGVPLI